MGVTLGVTLLYGFYRIAKYKAYIGLFDRRTPTKYEA